MYKPHSEMETVYIVCFGDRQTGAIGIKNSSYYWVKKAVASTVMWFLGHWTPETANTATYPRLTTTDNSKFQSSIILRYSTDRLDLQRVQLTL